MTELSGWSNFYVILGSAAGALIGLQFVLITLITSRPLPRMAEAGTAFMTPTIVHFSGVLAMAAILCAPWSEVTFLSVLWGVMGLAGTGYAVTVARRMKWQQAYEPDLEDWAFHVVLPFTSYAVLIVSAFLAHQILLREAMFTVAAALLTLLLVGIHNAWDAVVYHAFFASQNKSVAK